VLDDAIAAANNGHVETGLGRAGLDLSAFSKLAAKNEERVRQAAAALQDRLPRIVALAAIHQWKAEELTKASKEKSLKTVR
jgi:hypothetical protein